MPFRELVADFPMNESEEHYHLMTTNESGREVELNALALVDESTFGCVWNDERYLIRGYEAGTQFGLFNAHPMFPSTRLYATHRDNFG